MSTEYQEEKVASPITGLDNCFKVFNDTEGKQEDRPIFLDIPYLDSRYEMLEEE